MDTEQAKENVLDQAFWRDFAPDLPISDRPAQTAPSPRDAAADRGLRQRVIEEGYLHVADLQIDAPFAEMRDVMERLRDLRLPPAFVGVYDAPWVMCARLRGLMDNLFGVQASLVPDFWGWVVRNGEAGFPPHRDRIEGAINARGHPIAITVWMPLGRATPENGCMHVCPANYDAAYLESSGQEQFAIQSVRAVPADPGEAVLWTGRVFHWGGSCGPHAPEHRVSIAWEFQDSRYAPLEGYVMETYPDIPFETRLALIARQIQFYRKRSPDGERWGAIAGAINARHSISELAKAPA